MPQSPADNQVPLVVDLDGTLIQTDLLWECLAQRFRRNPFALFIALFQWTRGRARLKQWLGRRANLNPSALPFNQQFLAWLRQQKAAGRKIVLATASDFQMAKPVADYAGIFDELLASDGRVNLRGKNKLKALVEKFGERGFDYAGNSFVDVPVWSGAREAIVVSPNPLVEKKAASVAKIAMTFGEGSSLATLKSFLDGLFIRSGYLLAIVAGLLLAAAFPKVNFAGGAWVAPALLALAGRNKNGGDVFRVGLVAGLVFWLVSLYWLLNIPYTWHSIPVGPAAGWLALCGGLALFTAAWVWLVSNPSPRLSGSWAGRLSWALAGAASWVALEMVRARILGGFPWDFLGVSQFKMIPLIQIASVTGVYGVSFLVVWTSLSFYSGASQIFLKRDSRSDWLPEISQPLPLIPISAESLQKWSAWQPEIFPPLLAVIVLFAWGEIKVSQPAPTTATLRVALIQPSIPQNLIWDETANANRFQQLLETSANALTNHVDLLVWPESAVPEFDDATYASIARFAATHDIWLIFNADDVEQRTNAPNQYDVFNAAFLIGPDGRLRDDEIYHKQKLVMFGEYIPLAWLPFMKWLTPIGGGYTPGRAATQFALENLGVTASPLICFEDQFPQIARKAAAGGADFLINLTNDGWFGQSAEQWQHETSALFRAVENGVPLVRCCNNGVTCWIDANGRPREIFRDKNGSVYGAGAMVFDLPLQKHAPTFYTRHGDWFGWSCVGIALIVLGSKVKRSS